MTVECENCKTRFHIADARIPAKGARVRCSRCHHRFHITPSYAPPKQPRASAQGSAVEPVLGGEAAREQDQLDNPEFLFDKPEVPESKPARARRPEPEAAVTQLDQPALAQPPEPKAPPPPPEERVVESGGMTAQEMLDDGAPELPTGRFEIGGSLGEPDSEIGSPEDSNARSARLLIGGEAAEVSAELAPALPAPPAFADVAAIDAELGEDEDSSFADWDPLAAPSAPSVGASATISSRASKPVSVPANVQAPAKPKRRAVAETPVFDPEATGPAALILRVAAVIVGLMLLGAAGRLLWLQRESVSSAPEVVQAAGWVAADLETFLARNATGERVVVVRGNLFPEGSAPPPVVEVRLLGADGQPLVEAARTWLERIDDAEVAPDRLALRLASAGGEIAAIGQLVTGFTAVIPDPPQGVRRVEVSLRERPRAPAGTATADAPPTPSAQPGLESASPSQTELPGMPAPDTVVPAAPEPE